MFVLDIAAHTNKLNSVHPAEKLLFAAVGLAGSLASASPAVPLLVFALVLRLLIVNAGIRVSALAKFFSAPFAFFILSLPALLLSLDPGGVDVIAEAVFNTATVAIPRASAERALLLASKTAGASAAFGFLVFTTPIFALDGVLSKLRIPSILRSLAVLMYRFIFITLHISETIRLSQRARGGYAGFTVGIRSLGQLSAAVIVKTLDFARISHGALRLRGFTDSFELLPREYPVSAKNRILILLFGLVLALILIWEAS